MALRAPLEEERSARSPSLRGSAPWHHPHPEPDPVPPLRAIPGWGGAGIWGPAWALCALGGLLVHTGTARGHHPLPASVSPPTHPPQPCAHPPLLRCRRSDLTGMSHLSAGRAQEVIAIIITIKGLIAFQGHLLRRGVHLGGGQLGLGGAAGLCVCGGGVPMHWALPRVGAMPRVQGGSVHLCVCVCVHACVPACAPVCVGVHLCALVPHAGLLLSPCLPPPHPPARPRTAPHLPWNGTHRPELPLLRASEGGGKENLQRRT